jgi:alpha-beta hydrolase superfamily lysophospholipase
MKRTKTKRRLTSIISWIFWVIIVQLILINISASFYAFKLTHFYQDTIQRPPAAKQNILIKTWRIFTGPRFIKSKIGETPAFPFDTVQLNTKSAVNIDAWYAKPDSFSKGTIILFHGITSNKSQLLEEAADFRFQGYSILMIDFRAHGNSGGTKTSIGYNEVEEVKLAYDYILNKGEKNIFLYGISMGAVAVMKAIADYALHPSGAILEMPFLSMQSHLQARARLLGFRGFSEKPFAFLVTGWISIENGFNAYKYRSVRYAQKVHCPVLLQYGARDQIVLHSEVKKIFSALASRQKKLVEYDHAGHESLLLNDPVKWRKNVENFLEAESK